MDKWDARFLQLAKHIAGWSKDPSTQVGAVISDDKNRVVSLGFNGFPRGLQDEECLLHDRSSKYPRIMHAEINALLFATKSVEGCTLSVWPLPPCSSCAGAIIQSGIVRVVTASPTAGTKDRWGESNKLALEMFRESGIVVSTYAFN